MVAASWSGQVLCYDTGIQNNVLVSAGKAEQRHELALDCSWFADGSKVATCGGDRTLKVWDFASNKQLQLGSHAAPIKACNVLDRQVGNGNVVATGAPCAGLLHRTTCKLSCSSFCWNFVVLHLTHGIWLTSA
jgi:WD40 repeat protein